MTPHLHDPSTESPAARGSGALDTDRPRSAFARPRWLLPALAVGAVAIGLVVAGVVSLTALLYIAAFGGMALMHLGGHGGHGGHAGPKGHGSDDDPKIERDEDLSPGSGGSQPMRSASGGEFDDRAPNHQHRNETHDDDQHSPHTCH